MADENTFNVVYKELFEHRSFVLKEGRQRTLSQIWRVFKKDILPNRLFGSRELPACSSPWARVQS